MDACPYGDFYGHSGENAYLADGLIAPIAIGALSRRSSLKSVQRDEDSVSVDPIAIGCE
jgi:hypothetical protein